VNPREITEVKELLNSSKKIVIVTHWSPDGDAMGSSLGLYNFLILKGHKVTVVTPNDYPSFLGWLPGNDKVIEADKKPEIAEALMKDADIIFTLDFNSLKRIEKLGEVVLNAKALKILIDHHQQPEDYAKYNFHRVDTSSTCELVYDFIKVLGETDLLNKAIASCLYTGIMTDTGSFRFASTSAKTHRVVAELIDAGAVNAEIHGNIYDKNTESRLKLLGFCISEKMKVFPEYQMAYITLSQEELKKFDHKKGDTEGIVNYPLSIEGINLAVFIVERDNIVKLSLRSKGNFDVNQFARKYFKGGGHVNAAGGSSDISLEETAAKLIELIPQYQTELQNA
jgi:bifunctional oligoribonuclease and PAP phosphatase NrnA